MGRRYGEKTFRFIIKGGSMEQLTEQQKDLKIQEIAAALGVPVATLLESKSKEQVIAEYQQGQLGMLND